MFVRFIMVEARGVELAAKGFCVSLNAIKPHYNAVF